MYLNYSVQLQKYIPIVCENLPILISKKTTKRGEGVKNCRLCDNIIYGQLPRVNSLLNFLWKSGFDLYMIRCLEIPNHVKITSDIFLSWKLNSFDLGSD